MINGRSSVLLRTSSWPHHYSNSGAALANQVGIPFHCEFQGRLRRGRVNWCQKWDPGRCPTGRIPTPQHHIRSCHPSPVSPLAHAIIEAHLASSLGRIPRLSKQEIKVISLVPPLLSHPKREKGCTAKGKTFQQGSERGSRSYSRLRQAGRVVLKIK